MQESLRLYINDRLTECECLYNIKVLGWFLRSRNIFRENSDLDIVFIFLNDRNKTCRAIHDIIGYGLDFWGWCLEDALQTLKISNERYYERGILEDFYLSNEHKRGGLGYFGGVFWMVGNPESGGEEFFLSSGQEALRKICEKRLVVEYLIGVIDGRIAQAEYSGYMTSYMYLNSLWRVLVAENIIKGDEPGKTNFIYLVDELVWDKEIREVIFKLLSVYGKSISKHSQRMFIPILNDFLEEKFDEIKKGSKEILPQHERTYLQAIDELKCIAIEG